MDTTIPTRIQTKPYMQLNDRQRSSSKADQNADVPSKDTPYKPQVSLHQGDGTREAPHSLGNRWQGESGRYIHQDYTNGFGHQLEEQVYGNWTLDGLLNEWLEYEELGAGEGVGSTLLAEPQNNI